MKPWFHFLAQIRRHKPPREEEDLLEYYELSASRLSQLRGSLRESSFMLASQPALQAGQANQLRFAPLA